MGRLVMGAVLLCIGASSHGCVIHGGLLATETASRGGAIHGGAASQGATYHLWG